MGTFNQQDPLGIGENGHIHMIGIGGSSMSGLALMLQQMGYRITGSNDVEGAKLNQLREKGIRVYVGHESKCVDGTDLVVYTTAVGMDNPELAAYGAQGIPLMDRPTLLGMLNRNYAWTIAVCGTHGKTTTTSMLAEILMKTGMDPTVHIGGHLDSLGGSIRLGESDLFLTEACEYRKGFLYLRPNMEIILNIGEDHLDCYRDIDEIEDAFRQFMQLLPEEGVAIGNGDDPRVVRQIEKLNCRWVKIGWNRVCDYRPINYHEDVEGRGSFEVYRGKTLLGRVEMTVPGRFNAFNALASLAAADILGLDIEQACRAVSAFKGARRRFELTSVQDGVELFHDYAHNPTEIRNAISIARRRCGGRVWAVIQPHTFSRVRALFDEYLTCTMDADVTLITDIYAAREKDPGDLNSSMLVEAMRSKGLDARLTPTFADACRMLRAEWESGDLVITLGCGNIDQLNRELERIG